MAVDDLYSKACDAVERGRFDYAIRLIREVLRQQPEYPDARIILRGAERRQLEQKGKSPLALLGVLPRRLLTTARALMARPRKKLEVYEDYLERSPNSFWALGKAADAARKAGLNSQAVQMYKDALTFKPNSKRMLRVLSDLLRQTGQSQEALRYLIRLADLQPTDRDLQHEVRDLTASDHIAAHEMETATSFMDLVRDRDEAARLEAEGRMAVTMDDLRKEVAESENRLAEAPDNVNRILDLAKLYVDTGQSAKAHKLLREKHEQLPGNYEIREALGDVQLHMFREAEAKQRIGADSGDAEAKHKLEELQKRRTEFAIREYSWRVAQHPTDRELRLKLGNAYFEAGQYNDAIAAFQNAVQDARYEQESSKMLGICFSRKGQPDLALDQFERAIQRHPDMDDEGKELHYLKAAVYEQMGNAAEALALYKKIYSQDIGFKDVAQKVESLGA